jgi:hypothetical protein
MLENKLNYGITWLKPAKTKLSTKIPMEESEVIQSRSSKKQTNYPIHPWPNPTGADQLKKPEHFFFFFHVYSPASFRPKIH